MNNQQFRRLVLDNTSNGSPAHKDGTPTASAGGTLGSRQRSSIPMTPRSVGGVDFARQLREQQQQRSGMAPPAKRFKSSAAPKGAKLAAGYTDRSQALREAAEENDGGDKEKRVRALEEQFKLGQISEALFTRLRDEIIGGDVGSVHLVKGLDRRLLERVKRGEDVFEPSADVEGKNEAGAEESNATKAQTEGQAEEVEEDVDAAFDALEQDDVAPLTAEQKALRNAVPRKRSRNDILRELKAARAANASAAGASMQQGLGSRFKKLSDRPKPGTSRLEIDERGREVLVTVDDDGNVKRKVRKAKPGVAKEAAQENIPKPDAKGEALGADVVVPEARKKAEEEEEDDGDIFGGVGADYDPLAGLEGEKSDEVDSTSDSDSDGEVAEERDRSRSRSYSSRSRSPARRSRSRSPDLAAKAGPRNYFGGAAVPEPKASGPANPLADPSMLAALQRAARIARADELDDADPAVRERAEAEVARERRRREMLANVDRDAADLDEGFGASRMGDQEEEEGKRVRLSEWGDADDGKGEFDGRGGGQKRKRGKKKRKGDGDSVADVMAAVARRKNG